MIREAYHHADWSYFQYVTTNLKWEGNGKPLQYCCLGNPKDSGVWWATVPGWQSVGHDWAQPRVDISAAQQSLSVRLVCLLSCSLVTIDEPSILQVRPAPPLCVRSSVPSDMGSPPFFSKLVFSSVLDHSHPYTNMSLCFYL